VNFRLKVNSPAISMFFISLMLILPFLFPHHPNPIPTFYMEWLTALFGLFAFLPLLKQTSWPAYKVPAIIVLPLVMLGVMAVQYAVLDIAYWQHYFLVAQYFVFAALMMLLGTMLKQSIGFDKAIKAIAIALLISGLLSTIVIALDLSNIHLGGWVVKSKIGGAIANVAQQNHLATLLALALASLVYLFVKQSIKGWLVWPLLAAFLLSGLALTASRSSWIFVGLVAVTGLLYLYFQNKSVHISQASIPKTSQRFKLLLVLPVLFYLIQISLPYLPTSKPITTTNQRLVEIAQKEDSPRLQIYQASWYVYADNPILGTGFGHMAGYDLNHANRVPKLTGSNGQAHNTVLQLLAETGVVGTTIFLVCILAFIMRVKSAPVTQERWLWWLYLCIIGIHAMLEYPLWYMHFLAIAALLLGLGDMRTSSISKYRPQLLLTLLTAIWLACLVQTMHDYRIIQTWHYQNKKINLNAERFDLMYQQLKPIRAFSPLALHADNLLLLTLPVDRESLRDKLEITQRLLKVYVSPALAYNYATLLALNGQLEDAKVHLNHVYMRHPQAIDQYWTNTVKLTLKGERMLFPLVKHIEYLRDGEDSSYKAPNMDDFQFNQPAVSPNSNLGTPAQG
jgi:O-antigen ligase